eukprot:scaffold2203_cov176-Amphora_coffeaeformis.AAC.1
MGPVFLIRKDLDRPGVSIINWEGPCMPSLYRSAPTLTLFGPSKTSNLEYKGRPSVCNVNIMLDTSGGMAKVFTPPSPCRRTAS